MPSRLRVPRTADGAVRRPRLLRLLDDGVDRGAVIVQAPAGSGKSHLVATWIHDQRTPRNVAWLTLSEHERDPARFVKYLVASVYASPAGRQAVESLAALPPSLAAGNEAYLLAVAAAIADLPRDVVLVLDDFQAVVESETELLVARMLRHSPGMLSVVVLSRVEPGLGQTRLRLQDSLEEIGPGELAFTYEEAADLARLRGVALEEREVRSMTARTKGWAAGLRLVVGALRDAGPGGSPRSPDAGDTAIADYLLTEVLEPEPPELQDFLLRATTADLVCADLVGELTGSAGAERTLADLHRRNLFLERVDAMSSQRRTWYRWHPLFSALLQARLHATDRSLEAALHRTASQWLLGEGFAAAAVRQRIEAGDVDSAAAALGDSWLDLVVAGQTDELGALLALFEEDRRAADPELMVACAVVRMQGCDLDRSCRCAGQATELAEALPEVRRTAVDAMTTAVRLHRATMLGVVDERYPEALELLRQMSREGRFLTEPERRRRALLLYHVGAFEASRWMREEAGRHLAEALGEATTLEVPQLVLHCRAQLASLDLLAGRLGQARTTAAEVIEALRTRGLHAPHALVLALTTLGGVEILRGEAEAALAHLDEARAAVHEEDHVMRLRVGALLHASLCACGKVASAREELKRLCKQVNGWSAPGRGCGLLAATEALQLAVEGHGGEALALMDSVTELTPSAAETPCWRVARAKALVSEGRPGEARAELRQALDQDDEGPVRVLELVVDAAAAESLGLHDEALRTLTGALDEAAAENVLYPFLLEGRGLRGLLDELLDRGTVHEHQVLAILAQLTPTGPGHHVARHYVEPLTPREVEVLRALQGTFSNDEIAERLYVSLNTLRTHVKHIHRKLGTASRREAVSRGRELAIL